MEKNDFLQEPIEQSLCMMSFIERFKSLSVKYSQRDENFITDFDYVLRIADEQGLKIKYSKVKDFYLKEKINFFEFSIGFSIKFNSLDFGMSIKNENLNIFSSAPWHFFADLIQPNNGIDRIKFRDYVDLKEILIEAFSIYEDLKKEVLKNVNKI